MRRPGTLAALGAVALLAALPSGMHGKVKVQKAAGISYVSKDISIPPQQTPAGKYRRYTAKCPRGTKVIGGGERNNSAFDQVRMAQSYPVDDGDANSAPDDGWGVLLQNVTTETHKGKAYAVCADVKPVYLSAGFLVSGSTTGGEFNINCPKGTQIAAGGTRGNKLLFQNSLYDLLAEETGFYIDNWDSQSQPITGTAVCLASKTNVIEGTQVEFTGAGRKRLTVGCPGSTHVISGGQSNSAGFDFYAQSQFPSAKGGGAPDDAWKLTLEYFGGANRTATPNVVCSPAL